MKTNSQINGSNVRNNVELDDGRNDGNDDAVQRTDLQLGLEPISEDQMDKLFLFRPGSVCQSRRALYTLCLRLRRTV